jgi:predicted nucleotidyltransferase
MTSSKNRRRTDSGGGSAASSAQLERAAAWLDERFGLDALWLFGSRARGAAGRESDVDLAALFGRRPAALELLEARSDLEGLVGHEVDLVDLDQASPILVMQVLRHGRLLLNRDPLRYQRIVSALPSRYEDLKIIRREAEQRLRERVLRGRS